jgi:hypothetical protein
MNSVVRFCIRNNALQATKLIYIYTKSVNIIHQVINCRYQKNKRKIIVEFIQSLFWRMHIILRKSILFYSLAEKQWIFLACSCFYNFGKVITSFSSLTLQYIGLWSNCMDGLFYDIVVSDISWLLSLVPLTMSRHFSFHLIFQPIFYCYSD